MVRSGRVQQFVAGDDAVLLHKVIKAAVVGNEVNKADVVFDGTDLEIKAFYPNVDENAADVGVVATLPAAPGSEIQVVLTAVISNTIRRGEGLTVRVEVMSAASKKSTYYLYDEVDVFLRGFPTESSVDLP